MASAPRGGTQSLFAIASAGEAGYLPRGAVASEDYHCRNGPYQGGLRMHRHSQSSSCNPLNPAFRKQKSSYSHAPLMSALGQKQSLANIRFAPKAGIDNASS